MSMDVCYCGKRITSIGHEWVHLDEAVGDHIPFPPLASARRRTKPRPAPSSTQLNLTEGLT